MPKALGIRHFFDILFVGPCKLQTSFEFCSNNMEFVTLLSITVIFLVALIIFRQLGYKFLPSTSIRTLKKLKLPPGKTGWPIIGESLEFLGTGRSGCPEKFIHDRMHTFSSQIFKTSLFCESIAVFCGPLGNKFLFSNENKLVTSWWPRSLYKIVPSQPVANSPEATRMRKMLVRFLNPETLHSFVGVMDSVAKNHLKTCWDNKSQVLVYPLAKSYTFSLAWKLFVSIDDPIQVAKLSDAFSVVLCGVISLPVDLPGTSLNKSIRAANFIRKHLHEIIKRRKIDLEENKASPTQDILSLMLLTCDDNGQFLTEADIVDKILVLILAGHDTASAAITFVIKYLAELPHIYNEVLKEQMEIMKSKAPGELVTSEDIKKMKYSWNVACEVMRHSPPVQGTFREAMTDFTYQGYTIPKGWKLYWSGNSTHKNANYFPDPSRFDPSRFEGNGPAPYTYVPFGGGPRMCPGVEYARLDILVFMHNVVTKFRWEKIYPDEEIVVDPLPIPAKGLPIQLQPHAC